MNRWVGLGLLLIIAGAWALRGPQLALRPMHNDEAVNAIKIQQLWQTGRYTYDPNEHHGPTLYYATLPFVWLSGAPDFDHLSEGTLRAVSIFFGLVLILLFWLVADGLGARATLAAAALTAISPAMVFYSRYFIHEMLLVCFSMILIAAGWRYTQTRHWSWAALGGAGLGLMYATKETFALAVAAMMAAVALAAAWKRWSGQETPSFRALWNWKHAWTALGVAVAIALLFFTSFCTNSSGPWDSLRTYLPWLKRVAGDTPHIHPWYFYLQRLTFFQERKGPIWSEGLVLLLAAIGAIAALTRRELGPVNVAFARFLTFYTLALTASYSVIAYKTPWCLLGFWHGMLLLAGIGTVVLVRSCSRRVLQMSIGLVLLAAAAQLSWQAWRASYLFPADPRNPYVYAQTVPDILKLVQRVQGLAQVAPEGHRMLLKVMAPDSDYWPLPWYLREFSRVGWWDRLPPDPYAPVMIVGAKLRAALDEKSDKRWLMVGFFELRPKTFLELYVQFDLWQRYVQTLPRTVNE